ncbi:hypothetical protein [Nocardia farcinica]|uniref:hypothetical protein n=1 Tax=Nocardia farcinica TaxID=37329 RepID=UPI001E385758|nr:hypothetical protein [Nocardia farcinica]
MALAWAHHLDIYCLGTRGLAARREIQDEYAAALRTALADVDWIAGPTATSRLMGLVGGISELILAAIEADHGDRLVNILDDIIDFL